MVRGAAQAAAGIQAANSNSRRRLLMPGIVSENFSRLAAGGLATVALHLIPFLKGPLMKKVLVLAILLTTTVFAQELDTNAIKKGKPLDLGLFAGTAVGLYGSTSDTRILS